MPVSGWLRAQRVLVLATLLACIAIGCATGAANAGPHAATTGQRAAGQSAQVAPAAGSTPQVLPPEGQLPPVTFYAESGGQPQLFVTIADTLEEQNTGLMNVEAMPADEGELFIFDDYTTTPFYMKDTLIPLSIAWVDENGYIVDIQDMAPETLDLHYPAKPYRYAIEANLGWYAQNDVHVGDFVDLAVAYQQSPVYGNPGGSQTPLAGQ
jgi:uncharacterized membrane protein (UPF0127 family)